MSMPHAVLTQTACRPVRDARLRPEIRRVWEENFQVYCVRKVWRQLRREGIEIARCTAARLMKQMELAGVIRGKPMKTTVSNSAAPCPRDKVNRQFYASRPNALWVSDFTYVATWQGFVYVAFVRSMSSLGGSSVGAYRGPLRPASFWILLSRRFTKDAPSAGITSFITVRGVRLDPLH